MEPIEFIVKSKLDGTDQPSLFYAAKGEHRPLLVVLHSWSYGRQNIKKLLPLAEKNDFNVLSPDFRGANLVENPKCQEACGSELAKADIIEAIDYVIENYDVDSDNIFLVGASGGGHMALLMAGYAPERFKAIAAVASITDLAAWVTQSEGYGRHVIACTGGDENEMRLRSPMNYIDKIAEANLKIYHGKWDPVVPVSHSVNLYNELSARHPEAKVYLDLFDGGHALCSDAVEIFILSQYKKKPQDTITK